MRVTRPQQALRFEAHRLQALIFDVDGTLYDQRPVRAAMIWRLLRSHVGRPQEGRRVLRALKAYRHALEQLRYAAEADVAVAEAQLARASQLCGLPEDRILEAVRRWMEEEPLDLLLRARRDCVVDLLETARRRRLKLGVFSDYPAHRKLAAMDLLHFFDVVVTAHDSDVQRFKPHPRGLQVTLRRLGTPVDSALYVGDRREVDEVAAARAGLPSLLLESGVIGSLRNAGDASCQELTRAIAGAPREETHVTAL
jgi:FMN phosphatase YigB (HAD superfamily)